MKKAKSYRLKGSTLLEALVAMVILIIILGISTTIYFNCLKGSTSLKDGIAHEKAMAVFNETVEYRDFEDDDYEDGAWVIAKTVEQEFQKDLHLIEVQVKDKSGKILSSVKEWVYTNDE